MVWLQRALHLTPERWRSLPIALADLLHVEWLLHTRALPRICSQLGVELLTQGDLEQRRSLPFAETSSRSWAVAALCRRWNGPAACLRYALVMGKHRARSERVRLVIGVRQAVCGPEAHAWLETARVRLDLQSDPAIALSYQPLRLSR